MNFRESESYLLSLGNEVETMKLGLENIRTLLKALGDPQTNYLEVQVAGTNGKGSVCAFLDSICREAGILAGLYTSPHLVSITERIKIGGKDISEKEFARLATLVRETSEALVADGKLERVPTYFEQVTAMALQAFADAKVELAILETGLGGRYDATTAANAEIAAITRIDLDHQEYLGDTIEEIADEKAAILSWMTMEVVVGKQIPQVMDIILERCSANHLEPITGSGEFDWTLRKGGEKGHVKLETNLFSFFESPLGLNGEHQIENAQVAVSLSQALHYGYANIPDEAVYLGLQNARHPGRLEYVSNFLLDGAHNIAGAKALREYLDEFENRPVTMIFAAMKDKDVREIGEILFPRAERLVLTKPENSRALDPDEILRRIPDVIDIDKILLTKKVVDAIKRANEVTAEDGLILITGSLYLVGEAKRILSSQI